MPQLSEPVFSHAFEESIGEFTVKMRRGRAAIPVPGHLRM